MADYLIKYAEMLKMLLLLQILSYSHQIWTEEPLAHAKSKLLEIFNIRAH